MAFNYKKISKFEKEYGKTSDYQSVKDRTFNLIKGLSVLISLLFTLYLYITILNYLKLTHR